jgi:choline-sulfatase
VPERPDLLLLMTDQQRFDQVGFAGEGYDTPALDGLARRGVVFERAYSGSTVCVPSRISLLTGLGAHRVPRGDDGHHLREGYWTVARELRAAGYQTAYVGKGHFRPMVGDYGFDTMRMCEHLYDGDVDAVTGRLVAGGDDYHRWLTERGLDDPRLADLSPSSEAPGRRGGPRWPLDASTHPTSWVEREAREVLASRDPDRPLYLVVSFPHPHEPLDPPAPYDTMFDPANLPAPADGFEVNEGLPWPFLEALTVQTGPFGPSRPRSEREQREWDALVRGLVRQIDDAIGRLLGELDLESTVVGFTSDHGDYGGHRGLLRKVPWIPFEDLWRVPLLVAAPDGVGGRRSGRVQNLDWVPTALDYAGVPHDPAAFEGRSLRPAVIDAGWSGDDDRVMVAGVADGWPTIRVGSRKLITRAHFTLPGRVLFDLDADPGERVDLADDPAYAGVADELEDLLHRTVFVPAPELPGRVGSPS